ncbi:high affinity immunoglobulin gamma Fc receptor I [Lates calcarifer]|uniref:high affinity immunoglobulin gamma Fc receptor I n=1 Tax=Lates calcarifer TaxID=8187 RepID=UPI000874F0A5|nr:high affinity immunoglobulin gamma Fc receptor I [Lates calcarifer]
MSSPWSLFLTNRAITMDTAISLLVLSMLVQHVVPEVPTVTSFRAVVEKVSGDSRIFSGESVRLRCSIPDIHSSRWNYQWFKGSERLPQSEEVFILWKARVTDSGKFYCQGSRDTAVGNIYTLESLPVEINVDGGWAILQVPPHPALVGDSLQVTCRVRGNPPLHEVILYKDGVEVMTQKDGNPHFHLDNLTLKEKGMYSCRASWDTDRRTRSVISVDAPVQVVEVLSQPVLEIVADNNLVSAKMMKLICHVQYNARAPAPPINYYFYKNNNRLGTATSENHDLVRRTPGWYSCRAKVPQLDLSRFSESKSFGRVPGPQPTMPTVVHRRNLQPLVPSVSSPGLYFPPAAEPTPAQPSPQQPTAAPTFIQPTEARTESSVPPPSQPPPGALPSLVQSVNQTATPNPKALFEETDDMSGDSGDMPEESGDMPTNSSSAVIY